jgi:putative membrane-bound dehydrogenase-like protein
MRLTCRTLSLLALSLLLSEARAQAPAHGLRVPDGFEVVEHADGTMANDIFCMTVDPKGRLVVSGRGYIRTLIDDDGDGRADRALEFAAGPKDGAQGLLWEGDTLYVTGDGGLRRYRDADGDGRADGPSELIRKLRTGGEHDAHAIRRGPDGWLYVLCGNNTGVNASFAQLPTSPVTDPVAGCVIRFTPDLKKTEIVADGFRNAYGMDFNLDGELFTFDSDNERCVSLPWYEFTRFYHVVPGGRHGWLSPQRAQFWRLPPYLPDVVAPVATLGRGSPTGVVCYRHVQFPARYRGGFFLLDWTFGKVHFVTLRRAGASYTARSEVFLESVGDNGFAPTAAVVHPTTGDLFVSIGGRGTRGAVYRIRYPKGLRPGIEAEATKLSPPRQRLDWEPPLRKQLLAQARGKDALGRLRALVALHRHRKQLPGEEIAGAVRANWDHADRYVRKAAADLIAALPAPERKALGKEARSPRQQATYGLGVCKSDPPGALALVTRLLAKDVDPETRLAGVRLVQLALGGVVSPRAKGTVWEGYTPRKDLATSRIGERLPAKLLLALERAFPSAHADLDRELSRTLALLEASSPASFAQVAGRLTRDSDPVEDLHYLIVLARLKAPRDSADLTERVAGALLALDRKLTERRLNRDNHWPPRVAELYAELARRDPKLNATLLAHPDFGRPDHVLFTRVPGSDRRRAAELFLKRAARDEGYRWNAALVGLVGELPPERSLPVLRGLWGKVGLDESLLPLLARHPRAEDRARFVVGLSSPQPATVRACLEALRKLPGKADGPEVMALIQALGRIPEGDKSDPLRAALAGELARVTGQAKLGADRQAWAAWFRKAHPKLAARLDNPDGVDVAAWEARLARLDWSRGEAGRGGAVFVKASCAACHSGGQALGPDLRGVAGRFSRADLFTAILQPSRDVSPRYRTTRIETAEGKLYQGLVIYEATDGVILQTGAATTVRIAGDQIAARRVTPISLMPAGLLDALDDRAIADLYGYLRSLGAAPEKQGPR